MRWEMKWNRWAVCACVFVITITRTGPVFSFGFFVAEFYKMYQVNMATLTWISVMAAGMCGILSPIPVYVLKYFKKHGYIGCCTFGIVTQSVCLFLSALATDVRWMFLTFGLMYGVAYCFTHMSSSLYLSEIFPTGQKYHIIATATIWGGYAIGQILYNLLVAWLLQIMSWTNVFIILGAINLFLGLLCVSSFLLKNVSESSFSYSTLNEQVLEKNNEQINQIDKTENNSNSKETIQSNKRNDILQWLKIIFWLVGTMFSSVIMMALPGSFAYYIITVGFTETETSYILMAPCLAEIAVYILGAVIGERFKHNLVYSNLISSLMTFAVFILWSIFYTNKIMAIVMVIMYGMIIGIMFVYIYPASVQVMELPLSTAWYSTAIFSGIGILLGPVFSGTIFDIRQSYSDMFLALGILGLSNLITYSSIIIFDFLKST